MIKYPSTDSDLFEFGYHPFSFLPFFSSALLQPRRFGRPWLFLQCRLCLSSLWHILIFSCLLWYRAQLLSAHVQVLLDFVLQFLARPSEGHFWIPLIMSSGIANGFLCHGQVPFVSVFSFGLVLSHNRQSLISVRC